MKLKGLILILIILMSSFSFCNAESLIYDPVIKDNNGELPTNTITIPDTFKIFTAISTPNIYNTRLPMNSNNSNFTIINPYSNGAGEIFNYEQFLDYLLNTKDDNQPKFILMNGEGSDLSKYTYTICDNYTQPSGYHLLSDNYKDFSLDSDYWKGSLFYTTFNYRLSSKLLINNSVSLYAFDYTCFIQDIKANLYWTSVPLKNVFPDFPYTDNELKSMFTINDSNNVNVGTLYMNLAKIENWVQIASMTRDKLVKDYANNAALIDTQNQKVANARGEKTGKYWSPDTFGGYYENVDDNGLEIINWYDQSMKIPLDRVRFSLTTIVLTLDNLIYLLDVANAAIPSDFGMDKPLKFVALGVKGVQLYIKNLNNYAIETPYHELDQATMRISGEKSYRSLVINNQVIPKDPTPDEIIEHNDIIDDKIKTLNINREYERNRVYNTDESTIKKDLTDYKKLMEDTLWMLNRYGGTKEHKEYCENMISLCSQRLDNIDDYIEQLSREKEIYPKFSQFIDEQIKTLESMRWKNEL
jgi:hypothetical protein